MGATNLSSKLGENLIINPTFDLWQRGTSLSGAGSEYLSDRWLFQKSNAAYIEHELSTDAPTEEEAGFRNTNSILLKATTPDAAVGAADFQILSQKIEGYNFRKISNKNFVFSFWVKSPKAGIHCVSFSDLTTVYSYVTEYTVAVANIWQKVTVRVKHETGSGTYDYTNGHGLRASFTMMAGTDYHNTADVWESNVNGGFATANQVNVVDANGEFRIAQVQLHEGIDEIPFRDLARDFGTEVELCQRYFETSYSIGTPVGTATRAGCIGNYYVAPTTTNTISLDFSFRASKRINPVMDWYSPANGTINQYARWDSGAGSTGTFTNFSEVQAGTSGVGGYIISNVAQQTDHLSQFHYTADAEL